MSSCELSWQPSLVGCSYVSSRRSLTREDGTLEDAELEGADAEAEGGEASDVGEERVGHGCGHWWLTMTLRALCIGGHLAPQSDVLREEHPGERLTPACGTWPGGLPSFPFAGRGTERSSGSISTRNGVPTWVFDVLTWVLPTSTTHYSTTK